PAITPQPNRPTSEGSAVGSTRVHWPAWTRVFSANAPMPRAGVSSVPSASVMFSAALWVSKQYCGRPRLHARHCPQTARQFRITKSPNGKRLHAGAKLFHDAGGLVAEQKRQLVVDAAVAVGEVGVAYAARLHPH